MNVYESELLRWAKAGGHSPMPLPTKAAPRTHRYGNPITEKIANMDWERLSDRTSPLNLPPGVSLDSLIKFFGTATVVQQWDRMEPGWDEDLQRGGRY